MYRTNNCGELRKSHIGSTVELAGWIQRIRDKGSIIWIDLRDRYGLTQLVLDEAVCQENLIKLVRTMGREYVIRVVGDVIEREARNPKMLTGDIEIRVTNVEILNPSETPPFTIEDTSDGGDELRLKYRYLDIRRNPVRKKLELRHRFTSEVRRFLEEQNFIEVETPVLIKSTPEGARDFVVPSRMHTGNFYALPQSPQLFKQLLMIGGLDRYFQIVKCFRDEDLRADRQPEFTQIDCEMSFVDQDQVLEIFEQLAKHLFGKILNKQFTGPFPRITYHDSMALYGNDRPDIRFGMKIADITGTVKGKGFVVFDNSDYVGGICAKGCAIYSRKQLDELTLFVQRPQIGAKGLVYVKCNDDGTYKSSVDKFFTENDFASWCKMMNAEKGDLLLLLAGNRKSTLHALSELRLEMGEQLGFRLPGVFAPLWITDFPLVDWDEESNRYHAIHHPFTSPEKEDIPLLESDPSKVKANAYDLVINGTEIGGGSIRIHDSKLQQKMFDLLGFTKEEAQEQFGFLMTAFQYGAPPHGGIAFGLDRWVAILDGSDSIRDYIAFPKNNAGKDVMIDSPSIISKVQLDELHLTIQEKK